jgi:hypothetical protein
VQPFGRPAANRVSGDLQPKDGHDQDRDQHDNPRGNDCEQYLRHLQCIVRFDPSRRRTMEAIEWRERLASINVQIQRNAVTLKYQIRSRRTMEAIEWRAMRVAARIP